MESKASPARKEKINARYAPGAVCCVHLSLGARSRLGVRG
jgi:hypothetical protein